MSQQRIKYYKRLYKYALAESYTIQLDKGPDKDIGTEYIQYYSHGLLIIKKSYSWDGPSGPTIDTKDFMRGSLVHDVLYQLIREGRLSINWKDYADKTLKRICIEDGMSKVRAGIIYNAVKRFAGYACKYEAPEILLAP